MPNHIQNELTAPKEVIDFIIGEEDSAIGNKEIDFNKVVPMPQTVEATKGESGIPEWYTWSVDNWGTKWNAYSTYRSADNVVCFQTAWSCPLPFIEALSKRFPDADIRIRWADEDTSHNVGDISFFNGEEKRRQLPRGWNKGSIRTLL